MKKPKTRSSGEEEGGFSDEQDGSQQGEGEGGGKFAIDVQDVSVKTMAKYKSSTTRQKIENTFPAYFTMISEDMMILMVHQQQLLVCA